MAKTYNDRFGSRADIRHVQADVRYTPRKQTSELHTLMSGLGHEQTLQAIQ